MFPVRCFWLALWAPIQVRSTLVRWSSGGRTGGGGGIIAGAAGPTGAGSAAFDLFFCRFCHRDSRSPCQPTHAALIHKKSAKARHWRCWSGNSNRFILATRHPKELFRSVHRLRCIRAGCAAKSCPGKDRWLPTDSQEPPEQRLDTTTFREPGLWRQRHWPLISHAAIGTPRHLSSTALAAVVHDATSLGLLLWASIRFAATVR